MTIEITATTLVAFTPDEAVELNFTEGNPFDDNGGETDGPSYLLEEAPLLEGNYCVEVPETLAPRLAVDGYKLENIRFPVSISVETILEQAGITLWMYSTSQRFCFFVATERQAELVEAAYKEIEASF